MPLAMARASGRVLAPESCGAAPRDAEAPRCAPPEARGSSRSASRKRDALCRGDGGGAEFPPAAPSPSPGNGRPAAAPATAPAAAPASAAGGGTHGPPPADSAERARVAGPEGAAAALATPGSTGARFGAILGDEDDEPDEELDDDDAAPRRTASAPTWRAKCRAYGHRHRECHTPPICSVWARGFYG